MGVWSFIRNVATRTDGGRQRFNIGPLDGFIASQTSDGSSAMNDVLAAAVTREFALQVPAVLRGRNVICSIATLPLVTHKASTRERLRSRLLEQIDPQVPNGVTLAQTLEDLIFDGIAWWRVTGRAGGPGGWPLNAQHIASHRVRLTPPKTSSVNTVPSGADPASGVWIDGVWTPGTNVIRFDSPNPPLLVVGKRAIKRAALLEAAASMYAEDPRPLDYFTPAEDADPEEDDVQDVLDKWLVSRRRRATGYVPAGLEYREVQAPTPADLQLVQLQERTDLALANMLGLDPEDVGVSTTSRTYNNGVDRRKDRINDTLAPYMRAITDRLSMNDVTRRGEAVFFDLTDYLKADPLTQANVAAIYLDREVLSAAEVRADLGRPDVPVEPAAVRPVIAPAQPQPAEQAASKPTGGTVVASTVGTPRLTLSAAPTGLQQLVFDRPAADDTFKVDVASRTITGLALPWGSIADNGAARWRFERGSVVWQRSAVSRVKFLEDHDWGRTIGSARKIEDTDAGLVMSFKVSRGPAGDQALMDAEDLIRDGLSVGVDILDAVPDPLNEGVFLVKRAILRETSQTPRPAFDDARVTSVAASATSTQEGTTAMTVADNGTTDAAAPAAVPAQLSAADIAGLVRAELDRRDAAPAAPAPVDPAALAAEFRAAAQAAAQDAIQAAFAAAGEAPEQFNPNREAAAGPATLSVREPVPYRFDRGGNFVSGDHVFTADLLAMSRAGDEDGSKTDAGRRVMDLLKATFTIETGDVDETNPVIQRPDLYVDQQDYRTPLWDFVNKGSLPNGVQPFTFPKFSSASGLVGDHTQGVEPTSGNFVTTGQTVTPTAISGKGSLTREVWDMGGNPQTATLVYNQMIRSWKEGLESATATFLGTLTAATDIPITTAAADDVLAEAWDDALAELQFARGYDFSAFAVEKVLYKRFVNASDSTGRKLFPVMGGMNVNGVARPRFQTLDLSGVIAVPAWALPSTDGSSNNSWLFDPMFVHGWATAPQRLEFPGTNSSGGYAPVAMVDIAIWGYKAFANSDIAAVRQVTYDRTV